MLTSGDCQVILRSEGTQVKYWNTNLKNLSPYIPGEQPKNTDQIIKLNTNENPYPPSPSVVSYLSGLNADNIGLYPDPAWTKLRSVIGERYGLNNEQIFCGNGSDEILSLIFRSFLSPEDEILIPYPNYTLYETLAQSYGIGYHYIQSDDDLIISMDSLFQKDSKAVFFSNPNAPTGCYYDLDKILAFCKEYNGLFILDEAYIDFSEKGSGITKSGLQLLKHLDNLIVLRTFSKSFALAGIRAGYAFASPSLIEGMMRMKDSYNLSLLSQEIAYKAFQDYSYMETNAQKIMSNREFLKGELQKRGFHSTDSKSNFLFVSHPKYHAKTLFQRLKGQGILVRYFDQPRLTEYLRITIGHKDQLDTLLSILTDKILVGD